jgi:hypothetical protein
MLCPTKYDNGVPWDTIKQKAAEYGIGYEFYCSGVTENGIEIPVRSFMKWELDIEGKQKPLCNFQECERSRIGKIGTYSLRDGKLYICCVMACIHLFNKYFERSLLPIETDYLDIYKTKKYSQILSYLNVSRPIEFCGFCKTRKYSSGSPLERSKREISEWT